MAKEVALVLFDGKNVQGFRIKGKPGDKNNGKMEAPHTPVIPGETDKQALERRCEELKVSATIGKEITEINDAKYKYYTAKLKAGTRVTTTPEYQSIMSELAPRLGEQDWISGQSSLANWLKTQ